jgi:hypothetical protein
MSRYNLTDFEWNVIDSLLPNVRRAETGCFQAAALLTRMSARGATPKCLSAAPHVRLLTYNGPVRHARRTLKTTQNGLSTLENAGVKRTSLFLFDRSRSVYRYSATRIRTHVLHRTVGCATDPIHKRV